jgi:hypothetical protein
MALYAVEGYKVPGGVAADPYAADGSMAEDLSIYYGSEVSLQIIPEGGEETRPCIKKLSSAASFWDRSNVLALFYHPSLLSIVRLCPHAQT